MKRVSHVLSYVFFSLAFLMILGLGVGVFEFSKFTGKTATIQFVMGPLLGMGIGVLTFGALGLLLRNQKTLYDQVDALKAEVHQLETDSSGDV